MPLAPTQYTVVNSGSTVSSPFGMRNGFGTAIMMPAATSGQVFFQVAPGLTTPASADFFRVSKADGTGQFTWVTNSAAAAIDITDIAQSFPWGRLEFAVAATAPASATIISKL